MNKEDTLIIFGRSPFINEIRKDIPEIIKNWHTVGINYFCETFPDVEYVAFYDNILPIIKDSTIITDYQNKDNEVVKSHNHLLYYVKKDDWCFSECEPTLHLCVHTPSMVMNWAYLKGYKNVVIAGIDLIPDTPHFDSSKKIFSERSIEVARRHLEKVCTKYLNVYQLNPNSYLDLPKLSINSLLAMSISIFLLISSEIPSFTTL